ncbi:hypothetical protein [Merismopedia glauca]|uniref:hypothetical protein n=1 Tax=Merismopedia glauca TaxID=292586 RepID=UPI0011B2555A|nr:hypothetical protein [Merismopedia glauca]
MSHQTNLELAADLTTDPEVLANLEFSPDLKVREAVASNPNTPAGVLLRLGTEFPAQLLKNPFFSLLLLENPNFLSETPDSTLASLIKQKNVSSIFLKEYVTKRLHSEREFFLELVANPDLPQDHLNILTENGIRETRQAAKLHINFACDTTINANEVSQEIMNATGLHAVLLKEIYPLKWLAKLKAIPDFIVNTWLQKDINCGKLTQIIMPLIYMSRDITPAIVKKLAENPYGDVRKEVADNIYTPISVLEKLADDVNPKVRQAIAAHPNTPIPTLEKLAGDPDPEVRQAIARNPHTPQPILQKLSRDSMFVRRGVAENPNAPIAIFTEFARIPWLRCSILRNQNCPENIRDRLYQNLKQLPIYERLEVAKNPLTPPHILDVLALDKSRFPETSIPKISEAVAFNPNTHLHTFEKMVQDPDIYFRDLFWVGFERNPNISAEDLVRLFKDDIFRLAAIAHPNLPQELLEHFANSQEINIQLALVKNPKTSPHVLSQILASVPTNECEIRQLIAKHPLTSRESLEQLARDKKMHSSLLENPNLPKNLLEKLLPFEKHCPCDRSPCLKTFNSCLCLQMKAIPYEAFPLLINQPITPLIVPLKIELITAVTNTNPICFQFFSSPTFSARSAILLIDGFHSSKRASILACPISKDFCPSSKDFIRLLKLSPTFVIKFFNSWISDSVTISFAVVMNCLPFVKIDI